MSTTIQNSPVAISKPNCQIWLSLLCPHHGRPLGHITWHPHTPLYLMHHPNQDMNSVPNKYYNRQSSKFDITKFNFTHSGILQLTKPLKISLIEVNTTSLTLEKIPWIITNRPTNNQDSHEHKAAHRIN